MEKSLYETFESIVRKIYVDVESLFEGEGEEREVFSLIEKAIKEHFNVDCDVIPSYEEFWVFVSKKRICLYRGRFEKTNIKTLKKKALKKLQEIKEVTEDIPFSLSDVLKLLKKNRLEIKFHHKGLDDFIREMDRATNRLVLSFIISSTIIASSIFIKSDIGPSVNGISIIGISGFIFAFFGFWIVSFVVFG